jgi:lysophospholipase L1-like esterase
LSTIVALLAASRAAALTQAPIATVGLPTSGRPTSLAAAGDATFLVGTLARTRYHELFAIDVGNDGRSAALAWSLEIGARINGIAVDGPRAYLATSDDAAELIVVDLAARERVAAFDVPGSADGWSVSLDEAGGVNLVVRRNSGPERYRLAVAGNSISLLEASEDPTAGRPSRVERLRRYRPRGRLVGRVRRETAEGALYYLLTTQRNAQFQVVEEIAPVRFRDVDGDGVYRLGCVGDSNTALLANSVKWCERLAGAIADPEFAVINVAVPGATVNPNLSFDSDATQQMAEVLTKAPDALVLAFGTNDYLQGRTPQQIHDAYLTQQDVADAAGVTMYVATTPPIPGCAGSGCGAIEQANDLLRATFAGRLIEFHTGFLPEHFSDGLHCNDAGQSLRSDRARAVLGR